MSWLPRKSPLTNAAYSGKGPRRVSLRYRPRGGYDAQFEPGYLAPQNMGLPGRFSTPVISETNYEAR